MIYSLEGILTEKGPDYAVISCAGVGFYVSCSANTVASLPSVGNKTSLYTIMAVKENGVELAGFADKSERDLFKLLCSVNGVGAKVALSILSSFPADSVSLMIAAGNDKGITSAPGVGPRLAQRIVLELKDKIGGIVAGDSLTVSQAPSKSSSVSDAIAALVSLGFSSDEAAKALTKLDQTQPADKLISEALKLLAMR